MVMEAKSAAVTTRVAARLPSAVVIVWLPASVEAQV
jgi:hypothetical protein